VSLPVFLLETVSDVPPGGRCVLEGNEGHHASSVRRMRAGEHLLLTDGCGAMAEAEVASVERGRLVCRVVSLESVEADEPRVTVVQALPKGDRGQLAVELLTEVGVHTIVPWQAERCVSRWVGPKAERGRAKWSAAANEAAKQSRRAWWPAVEPLAVTSDVVALADAAEYCFVLHEGAKDPLAEVVASEIFSSASRVVIVVGPEGGLSPSEVTALEQAGASTVRLGPTVLRTSTAGVIAAALVLAASPAWGRRLDVLSEGSAHDER